MKVVLSDGARDDLKQIGDFIARDDPIRAESFVEELLDKARELGEFPKRFPWCPAMSIKACDAGPTGAI